MGKGRYRLALFLDFGSLDLRVLLFSKLLLCERQEPIIAE